MFFLVLYPLRSCGISLVAMPPVKCRQHGSIVSPPWKNDSPSTSRKVSSPIRTEQTNQDCRGQHLPTLPLYPSIFAAPGETDKQVATLVERSGFESRRPILFRSWSLTYFNPIFLFSQYTHEHLLRSHAKNSTSFPKAKTCYINLTPLFTEEVYLFDPNKTDNLNTRHQTLADHQTSYTYPSLPPRTQYLPKNAQNDPGKPPSTQFVISPSSFASAVALPAPADPANSAT